MVGGTFNHDGTALYEAMARRCSSPSDRPATRLPPLSLLLVIMAVFASVGAAGIPEAGLVTMIAVFVAVRLPVEHIPLLLHRGLVPGPLRTAINVMGDLSVTCLVDGRSPPASRVVT